jgi:hypothetical protein
MANLMDFDHFEYQRKRMEMNSWQRSTERETGIKQVLDLLHREANLFLKTLNDKGWEHALPPSYKEFKTLERLVFYEIFLQLELPYLHLLQ